ncbi:MAG: Crp/Fnr family transcriptional regulator [Flavobacteriaceae bacterium]|nr:Crp/Fnr family transcriptional regulator [Flavobacteriaceae bacterium]
MELSRKNKLLKTLNKKEKDLLEMYSNEIFFEREEPIIKINSALHSVYFIEKGMVKYKDAEQKLYFIAGEDDFVGLPSLFNEKKKIYSAYAVKNTKIIQIEKSIVKKLISTNPLFLEEIMKIIGNRVMFFMNHLCYRNKHINGALASFLLMYENKECLHNLTRKEIGELIGYSRENVSKALKGFLEEGLIKEENDCFKIIDMENLTKISKFG